VTHGHNAGVWILNSPRWRRRLVWPAALIVVGVPLVILGIHYSNPGNPGAATGPNINVPGYSQPKNAPYTKARQREVSRVLRQFILTAVDRQNVGSSWEISAPSLREGVSHKQWNNGDLPVVPYPAADRGLGQGYLEYSQTNAVGLEVYLFPKPGSGYSALTADVELVKGGDGRWRVSYWMPKKFHGPPAVARTKVSKAKAKTVAKRAKATVHKAAGKRRAASAPPPAVAGPPKHSRAWWIIPIALLALIVVAPLALATRAWYRNRREYSRSLSR
jgi:hypothetical protein